MRGPHGRLSSSLKIVGGGLPGLRGFAAVFIVRCTHSLYTEWRESTPHTQTLLPNTRLARPACYTMATFSLRVLSACFCCLPLGVGSKASGWKRGRQGRRRRHQGRRCRGVCPCLCVGGVARRGSGRAAGRNRKATAAAGTGAVAVTQGWWRPPRAGCSRQGEVAGGRDRCALLECARQSSSGCSHGDLRARGRQGSRRSPCSPGAQSRWGVGGERAARPAYR